MGSVCLGPKVIPLSGAHCTVKSVYNGHPWDSKKVAVVQKSVLVAGCSYKIGDQTGLCKDVVIAQRWSLTQVWLYIYKMYYFTLVMRPDYF